MTKLEIDALTAGYPLPVLEGWKPLRQARYGFWTAYRRLCALTILINAIVFVILTSQSHVSSSHISYTQAATASGANLVIAALTRQEHCVNLLFRLAWKLPHRTPLYIRRNVAKIGSYGGLHAGCGISALLWYVLYTTLIIGWLAGVSEESKALKTMAIITLVLLSTIISMAHPQARKRWHDQWEICHRYGGWIAIGLVWTQTIIVAIAHAADNGRSVAIVLITSPTFWFLVLITICLICPWIRLRRRQVLAEKLSDHAVRPHFDDASLPTCVGYRLAKFPVGQNHAFAAIPNAEGGIGYSLLVSNAGNWTKALIDDPPASIWMRGAPLTGVLRVATIFRPVVVLATGSGIGPCLSLFQVDPEFPLHIVWSARRPRATYGSEIVEAVQRADQHALIIDTKETGHPDLPAIAYAMYRKFRAEAIFIISNATATNNVVFEMEARNIPAFGPIFDS